jgi:hypothetical protein
LLVQFLIDIADAPFAPDRIKIRETNANFSPTGRLGIGFVSRPDHHVFGVIDCGETIPV